MKRILKSVKSKYKKLVYEIRLRNLNYAKLEKITAKLVETKMIGLIDSPKTIMECKNIPQVAKFIYTVNDVDSVITKLYIDLGGSAFFEKETIRIYISLLLIHKIRTITR